MNDEIKIAKMALDKIIEKSRIHFYKPIQIAEILYYYRLSLSNFDPYKIDSYRNISKIWRDEVSKKLVGRVSTSSQKYQDNLFDKNALEPRSIAVLCEVNKQLNGLIENYIYHRLYYRLRDVFLAYEYLNIASTSKFSLSHFLSFFEQKSSLKRSIDKAFEIVVYALFATLVEALDAKINLSLSVNNPALLQDFESFTEIVLGISSHQPTVSHSARLYRAGLTNAADGGMDILSNYGPTIQVKHLSLDVELAEEIAEQLPAEQIIIVCRTAEATTIQTVLNQIGWRIRAIITQSDLEKWYQICQDKYLTEVGQVLLENLQLQFQLEFPVLNGLEPFLQERHYEAHLLRNEWEIK